MEEVLHVLFIKASWGDWVAIVFVSNKVILFMSFCVICLVIVQEIFLPWIVQLKQKCIIFCYYIYNYTCIQKAKQTLKTEDEHFTQIGYPSTQTNLWSFSSWMSVIMRLFNDLRALTYLCNIFTTFAFGLIEWPEAEFQKC